MVRINKMLFFCLKIYFGKHRGSNGPCNFITCFSGIVQTICALLHWYEITLHLERHIISTWFNKLVINKNNSNEIKCSATINKVMPKYQSMWWQTGSIQKKKPNKKTNQIQRRTAAFFFSFLENIKEKEWTSPLDVNIQVPMYGEYSIFINVNMSSLLYCTEFLVNVCWMRKAGPTWQTKPTL